MHVSQNEKNDIADCSLMHVFKELILAPSVLIFGGQIKPTSPETSLIQV